MNRLVARSFVSAVAAVGMIALPAAGGAAAWAGAATVAGPAVAPGRPAPLANLGHLDFLRKDVRPPAQAGHTTYRLAAEPGIGVLWTYADRQPDGSYRKVGGGQYHPVRNTYDQGAYNADDISRAAVVYLRHLNLYGDGASRRNARQLLRGLTYLQTASGPDAGNVVLWMQPDGTLNPSPVVIEFPDPSDSGPSFWLARTIWALGEGYAAFRHRDPAFAGFLRQRMELALDALDRQVLGPRYGRYLTVDGLRWPAWLIVDGADASSEAVYGLSAYVGAGGGARARRDLSRLAEGIAAMPLGTADTWPFGAVLPYARSRSIWHGYLDQMSGALATASTVLHQQRLLAVAVGEVGRFTPHLLVQGGPDNFWAPAPIDRTQIAYGADATTQNLLRTADATGRAGFRALAGVSAGWFFGNNVAGVRMYDPATGVTFDGIAGDGTVNLNSGAESTIHGQLTMLALDAHPDVAARAVAGQRRGQLTWSLVEAESGRLSGAARVVVPVAAYTGESQWSGGAYVRLDPGGSVRLPVVLPATDRYLVMPVFDRRPVPPGTSVVAYRLGGLAAGRVDQGGAGPRGVTAVPGFLDVATTRTDGLVAAGSHTVLASYVGTGQPARLDAVLVQPAVEYLTLGSGSSGTALLRSFDRVARRYEVAVPGSGGTAAVRSYDPTGRLVASYAAAGSLVSAYVVPGGFTVVTR